DHLLVGRKLSQPFKKITSFQPKVDHHLCQKCGKCVAACASHALFQVPNKIPMLIPELCSACRVCLDVCPYQAVTETRLQTGEIYRQQLTPGLTLVTGMAKPGL